MSAKTSSPQVQGIAGAGFSTVAIGGAMLAATLIASVCRSLGSARRNYGEAAKAQDKVQIIKPTSALRTEQQTNERKTQLIAARAKLTPVEETKVSTLASLAATPYLVQDRHVLRQSIAALEGATTVAEVRRATQTLKAAIEDNHHLFVQALTTACATASARAGFGSIKTMPGVIPNTMRVIATNAGGHALVSELNLDPCHEPSIETEVIGVSDGSCHRILDDFDQALKEAGVRASGPPQRKYTGGLCESAAARDYLRSRINRQVMVPQPAKSGETTQASRRAQRLNANRPQRQR